MKRTLLVTAVALLPLAAAAQVRPAAPGTTDSQATAAPGTPSPPRDFVTPAPTAQFIAEAARGGLAEVRLGELAQRNGSAGAVKEFGQRMVADHGSANDLLKKLAQAKQIAVPTDLGPKEQAIYEKLAKLQGSEFDQAYAQAMVEDHETDVRHFTAQAQSGGDFEVARFARDTLPVLQQHLQAARQLPRGS
jgi:putative membrane protein